MSSKEFDYVSRIADNELKSKLAAASTVLIEGPKACGKTATANQVAKSKVYFDIDANARQACEIDPDLVLNGDNPRLFDEWQLVPNLWNHIRRASDFQRTKGNFILTGSALPIDDLTRHSGAGRISRLRMRTMSLNELGLSSGEISLSNLLNKDPISSSNSEVSIPLLVEWMCRGGWPATLGESLRNAMNYVRDYVAEISRTEIQSMLGVRHEPNKLMRTMQSLARNISTEVNLTTLARDTESTAAGYQTKTIANYLASLAKLFVIEELPAFSPHLRSRARLRNSAKQHFDDPSIAIAVLGANPDHLLRDLAYVGLLFESLVIHDLRVYASIHDATLSHYRDNTGLEVDAVIQTRSGQWMPVEVKLGSEEATIDRAATNLLKFVNKVDLDRMGKPSNLLIVTSSGYGYQRRDGVTVVPIGSLGP